MSFWLRNVLWVLLVAATALLMWFGRPGSRVMDNPLIRQLNEMRRLGIKMLAYNENAKPGETVGWHVEDYVAHGALVPQDEAYLREHRIEFRGFPSAKSITVGGDTQQIDEVPLPLLEATYIQSRKPRRFVIYSDGSGRILNSADAK